VLWCLRALARGHPAAYLPQSAHRKGGGRDLRSIFNQRLGVPDVVSHPLHLPLSPTSHLHHRESGRRSKGMGATHSPGPSFCFSGCTEGRWGESSLPTGPPVHPSCKLGHWGVGLARSHSTLGETETKTRTGLAIQRTTNAEPAALLRAPHHPSGQDKAQSGVRARPLGESERNVPSLELHLL
jgi:hypothetical protein